MKHSLILAVALYLAGHTLNANNLQIANASLTGADYVNDYTMIEFDVSWDNSWRDWLNYDAVWLFAKYSTDMGLTWQHAWLNTSAGNHSIPTGSSLSVGLTNISGNNRGMGVFVYRSASGTGSINWDNVQLRWEYGLQGLADQTMVLIKVFGVEMVHVPQGSFYVGDGTTGPIHGQFELETTGQPFQITSEASITLGGGGTGSLGNNNGSGQVSGDDFNDATAKTLPAAFPKGFNAFYCMKYEPTQEQYKDFLNTLTRAQQSSRVSTDINTIPITFRFVMSSTSTISGRNGIRCDASPSATGPIAFYCDYDGDGIYDESNDGQTIPCGYTSKEDTKAYLDWAGLRPMSELELEKACRGFGTPVVNEFAWGTTDYTEATGISNAGLVTEEASNAGANCNLSLASAIRAGVFASSASTRRDAGAGYWGIMELSGNLTEMVVGVASSNSRSYTGLHGDGALATDGSANVANWPTYFGLRCGSSSGVNEYAYVSCRIWPSAPVTGRGENACRGCRTAP
jgi:formylglycine-generating enzyme required for sulfatase activity